MKKKLEDHAGAVVWTISSKKKKRQNLQEHGGAIVLGSSPAGAPPRSTGRPAGPWGHQPQVLLARLDLAFRGWRLGFGKVLGGVDPGLEL